MLGDVANRDIDPDLRLYLKTSNVLHWGEARFWDKLKYALPDKKLGLGNCSGNGSGAGSTQSSVVSSTTSVMSSMSSSAHSPQNSGIYQPQPRYTMRLPPAATAHQHAIYQQHQHQQHIEQQHNNNLHHIYNMPGPQYGIYGGSVVSAAAPTQHNPASCSALNSQQVAAVHI